MEQPGRRENIHRNSIVIIITCIMTTRRRIYTTLAFSVVMLLPTACGGEQEEGMPASGHIPLILTASINHQAPTRTTEGDDTNVTQFSNTPVNVYLFDGSTAVGTSPMVYSALADGTMTPPTAIGTLYLPDDISSASIYATCPTTAVISNGTVSVTVKDNQQPLANYQASELLFAKATATKAEVSGNVINKTLNFNHLMTKIVVNISLKPATLVLHSIKMANVCRTLTFTPSTYSFASSLTGLSASNSGTANSPCVTILQNATVTSSIDGQTALIAPQHFGTEGTETKFIEIVTESGTAWYSFSGDIDFLPGCTYTINLSVRANSVGMTTVITRDWIKQTKEGALNV